GEDIGLIAEELWAEVLPRAERQVQAASELLAERLRSILSRVGPPIPGGPPAKRTGELQQSMNPLPIRRTKTSVRGGAGVWVEDRAERSRIAQKAAALEYGGTDQKGRVHPPYPFLRPTEEVLRPTIGRILEDL
ncbi:MAG TPA: hypothetical protein VIL46_10360, partial [Gemmataceae bacterium]